MKLVLIDIGGTSVKTTMANELGNLGEVTSFLTPRADYRQMFSLLTEHLEQHYAMDEIEGIAISSMGIARGDDTIGWRSPIYEAFGTTLVPELTNYYQVPVTIENDGNCAALCEYWLGNAQNCSSFATIVFGTSIGGAIIMDGKVIRGANRLAGEFGYFIEKDPEKQYEIWSISGSTVALVNKVKQANPQLEMAELDGKVIMELVSQQSPLVMPHYEVFIEQLAMNIYNLQYILDPEKILIGGGISASQQFIDDTNQKLQELTAAIPSNVIELAIEPCQFGNDANLLGALYCWLEKYGN
ncbi:ROK family protein [Vagococcus zengguangii]|uniref:ROK family protein n=1 Tax=Vagococcus zengguangii TaxID=2571750 RepID=A0A4D7CVA2_9ENTE|nr:ROK family protein [Vagococcus zengguangii]QCI86180.1 ROK family protein [Vagococcus zengguangii]